MNFQIISIFLGIFITLPISQSCGNFIIWDRDFCKATSSDRLFDSILPPNNTNDACEFELGSNITLDHLTTDKYENLFRVSNSAELSKCDASTSNSSLVIISKTYSFVIDPTIFTVGDMVYYISTSNGSKVSAENSRQTNPPCLQLAFRVKANSNPNQCRVSSNCRKNSILKDAAYTNFGCPVNGGISMSILILIYVGIPLLVIGIVLVIVLVFCYSGNTGKKLLQRSMNQEKTEDTSINP